LARFEFESEIVFFCFSFTFVSVGESCLLVSWCAGGRCGMACSDEGRGRRRRPGAEDSVAGRSRGRVAPCAVCTWHVETRSAGFLVEPQNQGRRFVSGLASKLVATVFAGLASKPVATVSSGLISKPVVTVFSSFASKLVVTISPGLASKPVASFLVEPQNQGGAGFPGLGLKTSSSGLVIWASKSQRRFLGLGHKTKQALVSWLHHKTDGGRSAWDPRRDLAACLAWKQV
jgi:hypothetical protein